jgi:3-oxoadipyl-CoA thiolase
VSQQIHAIFAMILVHQLERGGGKLGLASLCIGVGMGLALTVELIGSVR